ncbi:MAG: type III polyketide synthase [Bryobacteraceae bacterium]
MKIAGVASAFPEYEYDQETLLRAFLAHWGERLDNPRFFERLHNRVGVETRHIALPIEEYPGLKSWGAANNHWIRVAVNLSEQCLGAALQQAGLETSRLGAIFFVSVTGIASPSVEARLMNRMGLPVNIKRIPIFGLGCVAGAAGIARAADYVKAYPDQAAAVISVELCSLTLQQDDFSMANLISTGLFGDGAAAVLVSGDNVPASGPRILATKSIFYPNSEHVMGWDISERGFKIVLSKEVPEVVETHLASDVDAFLGEHGLKRADIGCFVIHTGGPKVLEATQAALELPPGALEPSWDCLRRMGNLSSASVLCVLEEIQLRRKPPTGTWGLLAAMGPAFCSELVLLRW